MALHLAAAVTCRDHWAWPGTGGTAGQEGLKRGDEEGLQAGRLVKHWDG